MPFRKLPLGQWCLFSLAAVVLLLPVLLAAVAPALAPIPAAASLPGWEAPPLPDRETPLPGFQDLLEPLPLVIRDLPDEASQDAITAYDRATLFDPQPSRDMVAAAERALPLPPDMQSAWNNWILSFYSDSFEPIWVPYDVLEALQDDPRNGDRLSNFAVALYFSALTGKLEQAEGYTSGYLRQSRGVLMLLGATQEMFPDSRAAMLNYAFLSSFIKVNDEAQDPVWVHDPIDILTSWAEDYPGDTTALHVLVSVMLHSGDANLEDPSVVALLSQLAGDLDAPHAALGFALLGDLQLGSAHAQRATSPFAAQESARQAVGEYDKALALSDDPSLYAARADALEILGSIPAAIETQERAVQLKSDSAPLQVRLGDLYRERPGDEAQVQAAMREARDQYRNVISSAEDQVSTTLSDVQIQLHNVSLDPGQSGRGPEYTASRPTRAYISVNPWEGMAGGGFIVFYDLIPAIESTPVVTGGSLPLQRAVNGAGLASVVLGEPSEVVEDIARLEGVIDDGRWPEGELGLATIETLRARVVPAAQIVADLPATPDGPPPPEADQAFSLAVNVLRYAGSPALAATLCESALDDPDPWVQQQRLRCLAENAYLTGEYDVARQAFADLGDPLYEGFVAQVAGDTDDAIRLYEQYVLEGQGEIRWMIEDIVISWIGDAYLESGDTARAIEHYDRVIEQLSGDQWLSKADTMALQRVHNNRGVARLSAQTPSGGAPDCSGNAATACADALADFEAALGFDPSNPVYLLGKAWVERLQGNPEAAIQTLDQAVQIDPTMYPALNDIGVLAVQSGDLPRARQAFLDAAAANPAYDLALWNLGVLEMQRGVSGVPRGQAYLARAIVQNPSLVSSGLSYRTDEEVYRVEFNEQLKPGAGWSFASATSVATTTFGFIAVLAIILRAIVYFSTDKVQSAANTWAAKAVAWLDRKAGRTRALSSGDGWSRWLPLIITLPALTFVTSWSALRENPGTAAANVFLALFAALTAVIVHETGHALVARRLNAHIHPAQWGPGTLLALVLLPLNLNAGPFPGQRIICDDEEAAWWVHLSGPLANLTVAVGAYTLFLAQPLPGLRLIALAQLAAMSYALLPFDSLDGPALSRTRPMVGGALAFLVLIAGLLFSVGVF